MMMVPGGVKVHLALGYTDMRKGLDGLAMLVQEVLKQDPFSGHLFAFRGKKASMLKILFWDGNGLCLFTKRLTRAASYGRRWRGSTGARRSASGGQLSRAECAPQPPEMLRPDGVLW
jgi:transposase